MAHSITETELQRVLTRGQRDPEWEAGRRAMLARSRGAASRPVQVDQADQVPAKWHGGAEQSCVTRTDEQSLLAHNVIILQSGKLKSTRTWQKKQRIHRLKTRNGLKTILLRK